MRLAKNLKNLREFRWQEPGLIWGLVPTMGALHDGHINLIKRAREENDRLGVSIFVNPIQFNNPEDLNSYPQALEQDLDILSEQNVDLVWIPKKEDIYSSNFQTYIEVENISELLEGKSRPGHFRGVATIVAILFNAFQPNRAYFGQKDAQQLLVIKQMVNDLCFNLDIISCTTVREEDGLAISSRNLKLSIVGRSQAICLYRALSEAQNAIREGERDAKKLKILIKNILTQYTLAIIDYISIADADTLVEINQISNKIIVSLAVFIEQVRLIDNLTLEI